MTARVPPAASGTMLGEAALEIRRPAGVKTAIRALQNVDVGARFHVERGSGGAGAEVRRGAYKGWGS